MHCNCNESQVRYAGREPGTGKYEQKTVKFHPPNMCHGLTRHGPKNIRLMRWNLNETHVEFHIGTGNGGCEIQASWIACGQLSHEDFDGEKIHTDMNEKE